MRKTFLKRIAREEKGITGLETAIILIAFVVVASVFAYTALSAGLFSTQKSQEAVYSGLEEARSTLVVKGEVVANGRAELNDLDFPLGWVADTDATATRETTTKWEGSGSLKVIVGAAMAQNDEPVYRAMEPLDLTNGDTVTFWIKSDATLDSNLTFALATGADLSATATETYVINTSGTSWEKHSFDLTGGNDDSAAYFGVILSTDAEGTFYLDKVMFEDVASLGGIEMVLDNMEYPLGWTADADATIARETTTKIEGSASMSVIIGADMAQNDTAVVHPTATKDWTNGDTITFWIKADAALDGNISFVLGTGADLNATATQTYAIDTAGTGWEKHTVTLSGGNDDSAAYYGIVLSTDAEGTFYLDGIELGAALATNSDPMKAYANQVVFTVSNVLGGEPVDFTTTTDADADGVISDEATKNHKVIISFMDQYQQVTDLTWTKTAIGKNDGDDILEDDEKFQITVDLTNINNSAAWDYQKLGAVRTFTLEVKPPKGAVLNLERTIPDKINAIMKLDS
ncbi:MAG: hypothetical protein HYX96_02460 [Chloroflexi bacterium]|nr:hypothetical protein [Chloroflexota bacterium]